MSWGSGVRGGRHDFTAGALKWEEKQQTEGNSSPLAGRGQSTSWEPKKDKGRGGEGMRFKLISP